MKQIFIVEDDNGIRELLEYLLSSADYSVSSFPTAEAFRKSIALQQPDLILMDIMLPDGNGIDLCRGLNRKEETNKVPVVLMSAHANLENLVESCASDFIAKPFDIEELLLKIEGQLR